MGIVDMERKSDHGSTSSSFRAFCAMNTIPLAVITNVASSSQLRSYLLLLLSILLSSFHLSWCARANSRDLYHRVSFHELSAPYYVFCRIMVWYGCCLHTVPPAPGLTWYYNNEFSGVIVLWSSEMSTAELCLRLASEKSHGVVFLTLGLSRIEFMLCYKVSLRLDSSSLALGV